MREQGHLILAGDASANITSTGMQLDNTNAISIQTIFTGSPVGVFVAQTSNDVASDPTTVVNWQNYSGLSEHIIEAGSVMWEVNPISVKWIRVVWTVSSGTGSITSSFYSVVSKE